MFSLCGLRDIDSISIWIQSIAISKKLGTRLSFVLPLESIAKIGFGSSKAFKDTYTSDAIYLLNPT